MSDELQALRVELETQRANFVSLLLDMGALQRDHDALKAERDAVLAENHRDPDLKSMDPAGPFYGLIHGLKWTVRLLKRDNARLEDALDLERAVTRRLLVRADCNHGRPLGVHCEAGQPCARCRHEAMHAALTMAWEAMQDRRSYVNGGDPATCWQEMKYGVEWDTEDNMVQLALRLDPPVGKP